MVARGCRQAHHARDWEWAPHTPRPSGHPRGAPSEHAHWACHQPHQATSFCPRGTTEPQAAGNQGLRVREEAWEESLRPWVEG